MAVSTTWTTGLALVIGPVLLWHPALAAERLAIHPAITADGEVSTMAPVDEAVASAVAAAGFTEVVGADMLGAILPDLQAKGLRCSADDVACFAKIGQAAEVHRLLVPQVRTGDEGLVFSCTLIKTVDGALINTARSGPHLEYPEFVAGVGVAVTDLLRPPSSTGRLQIQVNVDGAEVALDGARLGVSPLTGPVADLQPGRYQIEAQASGYLPRLVQAEVQAGELTTVSLELAPVAPPPPPGPPPTVAERPATSESAEQGDDGSPQLLWAGGITLGVGALATMGFALTAVTGELSYRIARVWRPDPTDLALLTQRRDQLATGQLLTVLGLAGSAVGLATMAAGSGMLAVGALE